MFNKTYKIETESKRTKQPEGKKKKGMVSVDNKCPLGGKGITVGAEEAGRKP